MHVRRKPELWLWMHRRWRDAPTPNTPGMFPKAKNEDSDQGSAFAKATADKSGIGDQGEL
jgi:hypothetical protein